MIVAPPRLVGSATVAEFIGVSLPWLRRQIGAATPPYSAVWAPGYLGKIANRHTWNFPVLIASTFDSNADIEAVVRRLTSPAADPLDALLCGVPGCDNLAEQVGLCDLHLRRLFTAWRRAGRSTLVTVQLVAMCRWIVDRNAHLALPADFDPWANVCMTPGCGQATNTSGHDGWHGPLCIDCSAKFWGYRRDRPRPAHWKPSRAA